MTTIQGITFAGDYLLTDSSEQPKNSEEKEEGSSQENRT